VVFYIDFGVLQIGKIVGLRLINLCFKGKYTTIYCIMYFKRQNIYLRTGFDG
jgi:hypothetical protein